MNYGVSEYEQGSLGNQRGQKGFEIVGCDLEFLKESCFKVSAISWHVDKQNNKLNNILEASIL